MALGFCSYLELVGHSGRKNVTERVAVWICLPLPGLPLSTFPKGTPRCLGLLQLRHQGEEMFGHLKGRISLLCCHNTKLGTVLNRCRNISHVCISTIYIYMYIYIYIERSIFLLENHIKQMRNISSEPLFYIFGACGKPFCPWSLKVPWSNMENPWFQ